MSSTDSRVDGRQSRVIAEPSFLEDESSPAGFRRFAHSPEAAMWKAKLKPQSTACSVSPMLLTRPLIIINQMAKSVSS
jgi:hypothetical protein